MRLEGKQKLGFFPLPVPEAGRIRRCLRFSPEVTSAVDPCVGDGRAFAIIAEGQNVNRYGIELDYFRAEQARASCHETIRGDALQVFCRAESCSLMYENPPYDWELGQSQNRRLEYVFLEHTFRWLKPDAILVLVIPVERLQDCSKILVRQFKTVRVYRLTELDSQKYRQVVVFGVRRSQRERDKLLDSDIFAETSYYSRVAASPLQIPELRDNPDCIYHVPPSEPLKLTYRGLPLDLIEDLLPGSPAYRQAAAILFGRAENIEGRPLTPLHGGHVGLLCTAGMLNGSFGHGEQRHIAYWQTVKTVHRSEETDDDGKTTIRETERFANELTIAYANGEVATLK
jgi:hypothetical protein